MKFKLNKEKNIGRVLFIVEGEKTEPFILSRIFQKFFDYNVTTIKRNGKKVHKYESKSNRRSKVFVINPEGSNIKFIDSSNEYLDDLFRVLIDQYNFPVDKASIFYLFDRDIKSYTGIEIFENLINTLGNSRDNGTNMQGLLLLSYPSIESYVASNFIDGSYLLKFDTGKNLKRFLNEKKLNQKDICDDSIIRATSEMSHFFNDLGIEEFEIDCFSGQNNKIFNYQESYYKKEKSFRLLSLLSIALLDLGLLTEQ